MAPTRRIEGSSPLRRPAQQAGAAVRVGGAAVTLVTASNPAPANTVLGYSYDALNSPYIDHKAVKRTQIVDMAWAREANIVEQRDYAEGHVTILTENSVHALAKSFSASTSVSGSYKLFSASFSSSYKQETNSSTEKAFSLVKASASKKRYYFTDEHYQQHLNAAFASDLERMEPKAFFEKYGTHLIVDIIYGGHMMLSITTEKRSSETKREIQAALTAGFGAKPGAGGGQGGSGQGGGGYSGGGGTVVNIYNNGQNQNQSQGQNQNQNQSGSLWSASGSLSMSYSESVRDVDQRSSVVSSVVGGNALSPTSIENFQAVFPQWLNSLDAVGQPCDLPMDGDGLLPLWELCTNSGRRAALKQCYDALLATSLHALENQARYVTDIQILVGSTADNAKNCVTRGYQLIDKDLNKGAGGKFIYLSYKTSAERGKAYTNLMGLHTGKASAQNVVQPTAGGPVYEKDSHDLNEKAGGDFIYLLKTRDTSFQPLTALTVQFDGEPQPNTQEWECVRWPNGSAADFNKGAGGKYVYIWQKHADA